MVENKYYERKIKYLDLMENGERVSGAGFIKVEVKGMEISLMVSVKGLHPTDTYEREVLLQAGDGETAAGRISLKGGQGQFSHHTVMDHTRFQGIRIALGGTREISCKWREEKRSFAGLSSERQRKREQENTTSGRSRQSERMQSHLWKEREEPDRTGWEKEISDRPGQRKERGKDGQRGEVKDWSERRGEIPGREIPGGENRQNELQGWPERRGENRRDELQGWPERRGEMPEEENRRDELQGWPERRGEIPGGENRWNESQGWSERKGEMPEEENRRDELQGWPVRRGEIPGGENRRDELQGWPERKGEMLEEENRRDEFQGWPESVSGISERESHPDEPGGSERRNELPGERSRPDELQGWPVRKDAKPGGENYRSEPGEYEKKCELQNHRDEPQSWTVGGNEAPGEEERQKAARNWPDLKNEPERQGEWEGAGGEQDDGENMIWMKSAKSGDSRKSILQNGNPARASGGERQDVKQRREIQVIPWDEIRAAEESLERVEREVLKSAEGERGKADYGFGVSATEKETAGSRTEKSNVRESPDTAARSIRREGKDRGNGDRRSAERVHERENVSPKAANSRERETGKHVRTGDTTGRGKKPMRLMEDKWQQIWAIYPHIRPFQDDREYLSISPADFVLLSGEAYRAANNSFLLHGYYNYEHLILTRLEKRGELLYYIGVPGNYYEREKQVAIMFGFESFECGIEPAQPGDFGYYMMRTQL